MSHVNEGQIHAYLDRQLEFADQAARERFETHVAECSDCTVLLEEARAIHARATGMLGDSRPAVADMPSFEAVVTRASKRSARWATVKKLNRTRALAWAASIVVAVAVGWYARVPTTQSPQVERDRFDLDEAVVALAEDQGEELEGVAGAGAATSDLAGGQPAAPTLAAPEAARVLVAPALQQAAGRRAEGAPAVAAATEEENRVALPAERQRLVAGELSAKAVTRTLVDSVRAEVPAAALRVSRDAPAALKRARELAESGLFAEMEAPAPTDDLLWIAVSRDEAERSIGGKLLLVDGLDVVEISIAATEPRASVRVVQLLPSGDSLEIVQQPTTPEVDRVAGVLESRLQDARDEQEAAANEREISSVSVIRGDVVVEMRGRISIDSLRVLLSRLR
ncbi:MAG: zf-HC2 domain-containing protein [Gemmatimonadetes bacterium]|nr:zf-HC2 domain-containing protein [Gemmatimonadota bacterium]